MFDRVHVSSIFVVPYIGTWIETFLPYHFDRNCFVVPYIGTWIETLVVYNDCF